MSSRKGTLPTLNAIQGITIVGLPTAILNTLQFDSVNNRFIWVEPVVSVGTLQYLAQKEFNGDRVDVDGKLTISNSAAETDLVTQTANVGKDMYLASASIPSSFVGAINQSYNILYQLYANGVVIDQIEIKIIETATVNEESIPLLFKTKGIKVATGQIIKITVKHSIATANSNSTTTGKLQLWEENTGVSP